MRRALFAQAEGVTGSMSRLIDLGVKTGESGQISLDKTRLRDLLQDDRQGVLDVLTSTEIAPVDGLSVVSRPEAVDSGEYGVIITQAAARASMARWISLPVSSALVPGFWKMGSAPAGRPDR